MEEAVNQLVRFLNIIDSSRKDLFLEEMRKTHPTIQQIFAGFVLSWINDYATNYRVDARNQYSIEECQKIINAHRLASGEEKLRERFPMI